MRIRNIVLAALGLAAFACSDQAPMTAARSAPGDSGSGASLARIASVSVTLASASIAAGSTTQATANVKDVYGNKTSPTISWKSSNTAVATVSSSGLVTGVAAGSATISANVYTYYGTKTGSAAVAVTAASSGTPTAPGTVTTLAASATSPTSVTLTFTQVNDGAGAAANYDVRFASAPLSWGTAPAVTNGTCATPLRGTGTTGTLSCTVLGLVAGVAYDFQLIAFRGTLNVDAKFGGLSNVAHATTPASITSVPPAPLQTATTIAVSPSSVSLAVGATQNLTATVKDQSGAAMVCESLTWSSSAPSVASVTSAGAVKGLVAGSASIKAVCGTLNASSAATVTAAPAVAVSSVTTSLASSSLQVGQTTQASAVARDASGNVLSGRAVAWASSNNAVATVSSTGLVTAVAAGSASISATSETKVGSASLTVQAPVVQPPPPPPPSTGAPQPGSGDVVIHQDNFDARTNFSGYATAGAMSLITGRGNAGKAARFSYAPGSDDNLIEKSFPAATDVYFRYYYRVSAGWFPYSGRTGSGMKWFMPWRSSGPRYTCGVGQLTTPNWQFTCHDNSSTSQPNPVGQNKASNPSFATTNDGQWHEYVLHIVTGTGGYEQIWIDGTLVLDDSGKGYDHAAEGISLIQFPGLVVDGIPDASWSGNIDIDDFVIWHK